MDSHVSAEGRMRIHTCQPVTNERCSPHQRITFPLDLLQSRSRELGQKMQWMCKSFRVNTKKFAEIKKRWPNLIQIYKEVALMGIYINVFLKLSFWYFNGQNRGSLALWKKAIHSVPTALIKPWKMSRCTMYVRKCIYKDIHNGLFSSILGIME